MPNNINLQINAVANFKQVQAQLAELKAEMASMQKMSIGAIDKGFAADSARSLQNFEKMVLATRAFNVETVKMTHATDEFAKNLERGQLGLNKAWRVWRDEVRGGSRELADLTTREVRRLKSLFIPDPNMAGYTRAITSNTASIEELGAAADAARIKSAALNSVLKQVGTGMVNFGKNAQWTGRQLTVGLTMPLVMFGAATSKAYLDFDKQMTSMLKVYGAHAVVQSQQTLDVIEKQVTELADKVARTLGIAMGDTVEIAKTFSSIGLEGKDLIAATEATTRLMKLGDLQANQAAGSMVSLQNVFHLQASQVKDAVNFLNAAKHSTSTTMQDIIDAIPRVGPIIQQMGGTYKDFVSFLVAMKESGVPAAQGANAIKSMLASIIRPTAQAKKDFQTMGIDLESLASKNANNVMGLVTGLQKSLNALPKSERLKAIEELFGKFQFARVTALLDNLGKSGSQSAKVLELYGQTNDQLAAVAKQELDVASSQTPAAQFEKMKATLQADLIPMGKSFLKSFTTLGNDLDKVLKFFQKIGHALGPVGQMFQSIFTKGLAGLMIIGPITMLGGLLMNLAGTIFKMTLYTRNFMAGWKTGGLSGALAKTREEFSRVDLSIVAADEAAHGFQSTIMSTSEAFTVLNRELEMLKKNLTFISGANMANIMPLAPGAFSALPILKANANGKMGGFLRGHMYPGMALRNDWEAMSMSQRMAYPNLMMASQSIPNFSGKEGYLERGLSAQWMPAPKGIGSFLNLTYGSKLPIYATAAEQEKLVAIGTTALVNKHNQLLGSISQKDALLKSQLQMIFGENEIKEEHLTVEMKENVAKAIEQLTWSEEEFKNNLVQRLLQMQAVIEVGAVQGNTTAVTALETQLKTAAALEESKRLPAIEAAWASFNELLTTEALAEIAKMKTMLMGTMAPMSAGKSAMFAAEVQTGIGMTAEKAGIAGLGNMSSISSSTMKNLMPFSRFEFDGGGKVNGPGGPKDDVIPAMLSDGEYVIQASAVDKYGTGFLDSVNARKYATGGLVKHFVLGSQGVVKPYTAEEINNILLNGSKDEVKLLLEPILSSLTRAEIQHLSYYAKNLQPIQASGTANPIKLLNAAVKSEIPNFVANGEQDFMNQLVQKYNLPSSYNKLIAAHIEEGKFQTADGFWLKKYAGDIVMSDWHLINESLKYFNGGKHPTTLAEAKKALQYLKDQKAKYISLGQEVKGHLNASIDLLEYRLDNHGLDFYKRYLPEQLSRLKEIPGMAFVDRKASDIYKEKPKEGERELSIEERKAKISEYYGVDLYSLKGKPITSNLLGKIADLKMPNVPVKMVTRENPYTGLRESLPEGINPLTGLQEGYYGPRGWEDFTVQNSKFMMAPKLFSSQKKAYEWAAAQDVLEGNTISSGKDRWASTNFATRNLYRNVSDSEQMALEMWTEAHMPAFRNPFSSRLGYGSRYARTFAKMRGKIGENIPFVRAVRLDPTIKQFGGNLDAVIQEALAKGNMESLIGRQMHIPGYSSWAIQNREEVARDHMRPVNSFLSRFLNQGAVKGQNLPTAMIKYVSGPDTEGINIASHVKKPTFSGIPIASELESTLEHALFNPKGTIEGVKWNDFMKSWEIVVRRLANGGFIQRFASGSNGSVRGPGGPKDDLIPAMLSNGEYVVNADAVNHYGPGMFDAINTKKFAKGGFTKAGISPMHLAGGGGPFFSGIGGAFSTAGNAMTEGFTRLGLATKNLAAGIGEAILPLGRMTTMMNTADATRTAIGRDARRGNVLPATTFGNQAIKPISGPAIGTFREGLSVGYRNFGFNTDANLTDRFKLGANISNKFGQSLQFANNQMTKIGSTSKNVFSGMQTGISKLSSGVSKFSSMSSTFFSGVKGGTSEFLAGIKSGYKNPQYFGAPSTGGMAGAGYNAGAIAMMASSYAKRGAEWTLGGTGFKSGFRYARQGPQIDPVQAELQQAEARAKAEAIQAEGISAEQYAMASTAGAKPWGLRAGIGKFAGRMKFNMMGMMAGTMLMPMNHYITDRMQQGSTAQGATSGALTGAELGMALGPEGALIGAGIGAMVGGITAKWKADAEKRKQQTDAVIDALKIDGGILDSLGVKVRDFGKVSLDAAGNITKTKDAVQKSADAWKASTDENTQEALKNMAELAKDVGKNKDAIQALAKSKYATLLLEGVSASKAATTVSGFLKAGGVGGITASNIMNNITKKGASTNQVDDLLNMAYKSNMSSKDISSSMMQWIQTADVGKLATQMDNVSKNSKSAAGQLLNSMDQLKNYDTVLAKTDPDLATLNQKLVDHGATAENVYKMDALVSLGWQGSQRDAENLATSTGLLTVTMKDYSAATQATSYIQDYLAKQEKNTIKTAQKKAKTTQESYQNQIQALQDYVDSEQKQIDSINKEKSAYDRLYDAQQKQITNQQTLAGLQDNIVRAQASGDLVSLAGAQSAYNAELAKQTEEQKKTAADNAFDKRIAKHQRNIDKSNEQIKTLNKLMQDSQTTTDKIIQNASDSLDTLSTKSDGFTATFLKDMKGQKLTTLSGAIATVTPQLQKMMGMGPGEAGKLAKDMFTHLSNIGAIDFAGLNTLETAIKNASNSSYNVLTNTQQSVVWEAMRASIQNNPKILKHPGQFNRLLTQFSKQVADGKNITAGQLLGGAGDFNFRQPGKITYSSGAPVAINSMTSAKTYDPNHKYTGVVYNGNLYPYITGGKLDTTIGHSKSFSTQNILEFFNKVFFIDPKTGLWHDGRMRLDEGKKQYVWKDTTLGKVDTKKIPKNKWLGYALPSIPQPFDEPGYKNGQPITTDSSAKLAYGGLATHFGGGSKGMVTGPGGPRSDIIPAMLSNGEYVIQAAAVGRYGVDLLDAINNQKFDVSSFSAIPMPSVSTNNNDSPLSSNSVYNITVNAATNADPNEIANTVMRTIRQNARTLSTPRNIGVVG